MHIKSSASAMELMDYITCWSDDYTMRDLLRKPHYELLEIARTIEHKLMGDL